MGTPPLGTPWKDDPRDGVLVAVVPNDTKTGCHTAYPVPAHWADLWLREGYKLPNLTVKANEVYGCMAASHWRGIDAPSTPYALRHACAIRCIGRVEVAIAAQWMGHSIATHQRTYQRWIADHVHREAWERLQDE